MNRTIAGLIAVALAAGLLMIGLWPFDFRPANRVGWLKDRAGLSFQPDGLAYSPEPADWSAGGGPDQPASFTMELWLEQGQAPVTDLFHILTIDDGSYPSGMILYEWETELALRVRDPASRRGFREVGPGSVLTPQTPRFITITVDAAGTTFYSDGTVLEHFPDFTVPKARLHGRLVLGNAAEGKHPWTGKLFGLALFNRPLDAPEVAQHYALWTSHRAEQLAAESGLTALYRFDEGNGQWVNDFSTNRHRLLIPERYVVLRKRVLELDPIGMSDLDDIAINIVGFMPLGFIVYRYRRLAKPDGRGWNLMWAVCAGAIISLVIELGQAWLPHRTSSINDIFTNTLGTFLGAFLARKIQPRTAPTGVTPP